jgi:hypothetical protein
MKTAPTAMAAVRTVLPLSVLTVPSLVVMRLTSPFVSFVS